MIKAAKPEKEVPAEFHRYDDVIDWAIRAIRGMKEDSKRNGPSIEEQAFAPSGGVATPKR